MTISTQLSKASFAGNGVSTEFPLPFPFLREGDINALLHQDGAQTSLRLGTHYTLSGAGEASGGGLTMRTPPATGQTLVIWRAPAIVQEVDYVENSAFPAETHEAALDLLTMICQGLQEQLDRSIKVSMTSDVAPEDYLGAVQSARSQAVASAAASEAARDAAAGSAVEAQSARSASEAAAAASAVSVSSAASSASLAEAKAAGMDAVRAGAEAARDAAAASSSSAAADCAQTALDRAAVAADKAASAGSKDAAAASATAAAASAANAGTASASAAASATSAAASASALNPGASARAMGGEAYNRLLGIACPPSLERKAWDARGNTNGVPTGFTFARASTANSYDATGKLVAAAAGVLRHDYAPLTGAYLGMLLEGQSTNLLTYSEQFDNAAWTKLGAGVSANGALAPDGTTTMDTLIEDTSNGWHMTYQTFTPTAGTTYTYSVFVKKKGSGGRNFNMQFSGGGVSAKNVQLDLDTGALVSATAGLVYSVQQISADTYRVSATITTVDTTALSLFLFLHNKTAVAYTGDGASGLYLWGAQLEAQAGPTSYIATTSAQATRVADSLSIATSAFPFSGFAAGTLYCECDMSPFAAYECALSTGPLAAATMFALGAYGSNGAPLVTTYNYSATASNLGAGIAMRLAGAWSSGLMSVCANGGAVGTSAHMELSGSMTALFVGGGYAGGSSWPFYGHVRSMAYFPRALSSTELQNLTK